jgi:hypothetical protein
VWQLFVLSFAILWLRKRITRFTTGYVLLALPKVLMLVSRFSADSVVDVDAIVVAFAYGMPTSVWMSNSKA